MFDSNYAPLFKRSERKPAQEYVIKGQRASKNEFFVASALEYFKIPFLFQVSYWGGRRLRGGQVLDFLCFTPVTIPVQVFGLYWHKISMTPTDRFNIIEIERMIGKQVIILWGYETDTQEAALNVVRQKII